MGEVTKPENWGILILKVKLITRSGPNFISIPPFSSQDCSNGDKETKEIGKVSPKITTNCPISAIFTNFDAWLIILLKVARVFKLYHSTFKFENYERLAGKQLE